MNEDQKCRKCGCTQEDSCVDKKGNPCYWVEPNLCSHCREFRFIRKQDGFREPREYFKTEPQLNQAEQDLLYNDLCVAWRNNTKMNRDRFIQSLAELIKNSDS